MPHPINTGYRIRKSLDDKLKCDREFVLPVNNYVVIGVDKTTNQFWVSQSYEDKGNAIDITEKLNRQAQDYGCDMSINTLHLVYTSSGKYVFGAD